MDGLIQKRRLVSRSDRYKPITIAILALFKYIFNIFSELGIIKLQNILSRKDTGRELKVLKTNYILLHNGIPISFNVTLDSIINL